MQTSEYRHLAGREKKYLEKPEGRRLLKNFVTEEARRFSDPASRESAGFRKRKEACAALRKRERKAPCS